jgi:hypothetical protein
MLIGLPGSSSDDRREDAEDRHVGGHVGEPAAGAELDPRDERHRAAADAVEQRHHLRHLGHLHAARRGDADERPQHHPEHDQAQVVQVGYEQRRDDRHRHADGGDAVAAHRGLGARQPRQPVDEQAERDDVEDAAEVRVGQERRDRRGHSSPASI